MSQSESTTLGALRFVSVLPLESLEPEVPHLVEVDGVPILLVRVGSEVFGLSHLCTHEIASLETGFVEDGAIECPRHGARFDLRSGAALSLPATRGLTRYPVRIDEGQVLLAPVPLEGK